MVEFNLQSYGLSATVFQTTELLQACQEAGAARRERSPAFLKSQASFL